MTGPGGGLQIVAGSVDITPNTMLPLFGRAGRTQPAHSVASRLEANCLLIRGAESGPAALVAFDSLYPSTPLIDTIAKNCAARGLTLGQDGLLMIASHTHNAPALDPSKPNLGAFDPSYLALVADRISECLLQLSQQTASAISSLANGHADCDASVYRRKAIWGLDLARLLPSRRVVMAPNASKRIGRALKLALFTDETGNPKAVLWTWPCHAVSEPDPLAVSADFPGAVRDHFRSSFDDPTLPVLYAPGFSGDIRPASRARLPLHRAEKWVGVGARFARPAPSRAARLHHELAAAVDRAREGTRPLCPLGDVTFTRTQRMLALESIRDETGGLAPLTCDDWRLGPLRLTAVSAEIASDYVTPEKSGDPLSFTTGCAGQVFGYIPTDSQLPEGGYEVEGFTAGFSVPGNFRAAIETKIAGLIGS